MGVSRTNLSNEFVEVALPPHLGWVTGKERADGQDPSEEILSTRVSLPDLSVLLPRLQLSPLTLSRMQPRAPLENYSSKTSFRAQRSPTCSVSGKAAVLALMQENKTAIPEEKGNCLRVLGLRGARQRGRQRRITPPGLANPARAPVPPQAPPPRAGPAPSRSSGLASDARSRLGSRSVFGHWGGRRREGRRARRKGTRSGPRCAEGPLFLAPPPPWLGTHEAAASCPQNNGTRRARWLGRGDAGGAAAASPAEGRRGQLRPGEISKQHSEIYGPTEHQYYITRDYHTCVFQPYKCIFQQHCETINNSIFFKEYDNHHFETRSDI
nr:porimin isoform X1 [Equus caballus]